MSANLTFTTLGELIKRKREDLGISLSEVSRKTGISKGGISKIENGETKGPELSTLKPIADVLEIPYEEIIEYCIRAEYRYDVYDDLLEEAIEIANPSLIDKVAIKFLENIKHETDSALEHLERFADSSTNNDTKVTLYNTIVKYSRHHGIPQYIAKGLLKKYLIEREDLKHLEESFKVGEEVLHYVDFLSQEEKVSFYYRMALHAHNINKFEQCIELGQAGFKEDLNIGELRERVALAICNSYTLMGDYKSAEENLLIFENVSPFIAERSKIIRANIYFGREEYQKVIPILQEFLEKATDDTRIHIVNDLLESYMNLNDTNSIYKLLKEENALSFSVKTPHKHREIGRYYKLKGEWLINIEKAEEGVDSYLKSILSYQQINAYEDINRCMGAVLSYKARSNKDIEFGLLEKLANIYNIINSSNPGEKGGCTI
ncbi:helix-turn-helix domain-containing protein [Brevibacillus laterosporus]|uniref:helix-turn-helix domain-containing protein n=1 Tax=Brevibacillus laterosporus TaxID=1465 RepID=UPI000839B245|nr:helix-turn-helix domain-containing protein [Brevibacillus laterosporus]